jgi:hypothetical protein
MTQIDFNHILASVEALSPGQMRKLLRELEDRMAATAQRPAPGRPAATAKAKRGAAKPAPAPKEPLSIDELHRQMMARGLITRLPDPALDLDDDPDDQPVPIKGEPLSETIIRERR